jgi:hypothetical protein
LYIEEKKCVFLSIKIGGIHNIKEKSSHTVGTVLSCQDYNDQLVKGHNLWNGGKASRAKLHAV